MAEPQQQIIPEDESFVSDEDLFAQAHDERTGTEGDPEPAPEPEPEPAPEPVLEPQESLERGEAAAPVADPAAPAEDATPAWLATLDEAGQAEAMAILEEQGSLRKQFDALHGRLAPVQQENARLRERLADTAPQPAQPANPATAQPAPAPSPADFNLSDVEEFKEFQDAFPDEAKALEAVFARQGQSISYLQKQLGGVSQGLQDMQQSSFNRQREAEIAQLSGAHPDWATVRPSEDFMYWVQQQPAAIGQLANSPRAADCIWLLDRYKADAAMVDMLNGNAQPPDPQAPQGNGVAQQTRARRQQIRSVPSVNPQLDGGVGTPNNGGAPMSDEDVWDQEAKRRLREQRNLNRS